jgi:hypothetical protein
MTFTIPELAIAALILLLLLTAIYQTGTSRGEHERRMLKKRVARVDQLEIENANLVKVVEGLHARAKLKLMGRSQW